LTTPPIGCIIYQNDKETDMEIIKYPDPLLRETSAEVKLPLSDEDRDILDEMYRYVKENQSKAIGLSAVQVGYPKRMCAIRFSRDGKLHAYKLVNPRIIGHSSKVAYGPEGCLSVDAESQSNVGRWSSVKVMAYDALQKKNVIIEARGLEAVVLQHEIDHMNGKLYIDYLEK
jgi:peptide deformylase